MAGGIVSNSGLGDLSKNKSHTLPILSNQGLTISVLAPILANHM